MAEIPDLRLPHIFKDRRMKIVISYLSNMKIQIINGPNLNLLGKREPSVYGNQSFEEFFETLKKRFPDIGLSYSVRRSMLM